MRQSLSMKKPSVDFNAIGPDFMSKISAAAAQANEEAMYNAENQKEGKKKGKLFWNIATSIRKLVTNRLKKSTSTPSSSTSDNKLEQQKPDFAR